MTILSAQNKTKQIRCIIVDSITSQPVENVLLTIQSSSDKIKMTDEFGVCIFIVKPFSEITISGEHLNYTTKTIKIFTDTLDYLTLKLVRKQVILDAVALTAPYYQRYNKVSGIDLNIRPLQSAQDALRIVPGLFIAQHAGGGKAEQIFLRGYDIDHGTDISINVDGMPVNMISHAHGQGYADLHFLIPETIEKVQFDKGPYQAEKGNLATAGFVDFTTKKTIDENTIKMESGNFNTQRIMMMKSLMKHANTSGSQDLYLASELQRTDGYFENSQDFLRMNVFAKYFLNINNKISLSASGSLFNSKWNASGQIPERAVSNGLITRFGSIDNSEGGSTQRGNLVIQMQQKLDNNITLHQNAFITNYDFDLFSNFTFYLEDSINGDMIHQKENRLVSGYNFKLKKNFYFKNMPWLNEAGAGIRYDYIKDISLAKSPNRKLFSYIQKGAVKESNLFFFYNSQLTIAPRLSINASARFDYFLFGYRNKIVNELNFSYYHQGIISPKLNIQYNASKYVQLFLKNGVGFHSNDARLILSKTSTFRLPKVLSTDVGANFAFGKKLFIQTILWHMYSQQEFVYVGDAGIVEPGGRTRRIGLDGVMRYQINKVWFADMDISLSRPTFIDEPTGSDYIPLTPVISSVGGISAKFNKVWNASLRYRFLGNRPANQDYSHVAEGYFIMDAVINYANNKWEYRLSIENLWNVKWKEAQFDTTSKLFNENGPVSEIHFTPGIPFFAKIAVSFRF